MRDPKQIHGCGVRFPLVVDPGFGWIAGGDAVAQALRAVLLTAPGERIGRPNFGAGLRRFLFAPNNPETRTLIRETVRDAIERDEPRARLEEVTVLPDAAQPTLLHIEVFYRLPGEPAPRSMVLPFYLQEGGG